jgi:hypothetical protein
VAQRGKIKLQARESLLAGQKLWLVGSLSTYACTVKHISIPLRFSGKLPASAGGLRSGFQLQTQDKNPAMKPTEVQLKTNQNFYEVWAKPFPFSIERRKGCC